MRLNPEEKERLMAEFSANLDLLDTADSEESIEPQTVDLTTLLSEMAILKNEVKLEARQFKNALDDLRLLSNRQEENKQRLLSDLEAARQQLSGAVRETERKLLLEMLDLRDRLQAGQDRFAACKPARLAWLIPGPSHLLQSLAEGQKLTLQKMDELLQRSHVRPIASLGKRLDPHSMRAVGIAYDAAQADGVVLSEARRGFYLEHELLRLAEVIINKKETR
jgi:molecular chaperone GrpE